MTLNQRATGSIPVRPTNFLTGLSQYTEAGRNFCPLPCAAFLSRKRRSSHAFLEHFDVAQQDLRILNVGIVFPDVLSHFKLISRFHVLVRLIQRERKVIVRFRRCRVGLDRFDKMTESHVPMFLVIMLDALIVRGMSFGVRRRHERRWAAGNGRSNAEAHQGDKCDERSQKNQSEDVLHHETPYVKCE